jgi:hypothetical protein
MTDDALTLEQLLARGWQLNGNRGTTTAKFTSVSLCLFQNGRQRTCVQGYGPTRDAALVDAAREATEWLTRNPEEQPARARVRSSHP